jgi:hypothetical protein
VVRFYTDENFPLPVVEFLRAIGHDVLTAREAGNANLRIPEQEVRPTTKGGAKAQLQRVGLKPNYKPCLWGAGFQDD